MKYSQFVELNKLLESNNFTLDEWKKSNEIILLKEEDEKEESAEGDDDKIETKSALKDVASLNPKKALMRKKLNANAKKTQEVISKGIIDKFIKPMMKEKANFYKSVSELGEVKNANEIVTQFKDELKNLQNLQNTQISNIQKSIQAGIDSATKKINSALEKSSMKDTSKADLTLYWSLLSMQISNNLMKRIIQADREVMKKAITDANLLKNVEQINSKVLDKTINASIEEGKKKIEEKKNEFKASEKGEKKEGEKEARKENTDVDKAVENIGKESSNKEDKPDAK